MLSNILYNYFVQRCAINIFSIYDIIISDTPVEVTVYIIMPHLDKEYVIYTYCICICWKHNNVIIKYIILQSIGTQWCYV